MSVRRLPPILLLAALSACTHQPSPGAILTRTEVVTREVPITTALPTPTPTAPAPSAVRCTPRLGPAPNYPDRDEALRGAPSIYEQVQMLLAGRRMRIERERELTEALRSCTSPPR